MPREFVKVKILHDGGESAGGALLRIQLLHALEFLGTELLGILERHHHQFTFVAPLRYCVFHTFNLKFRYHIHQYFLDFVALISFAEAFAHVAHSSRENLLLRLIATSILDFILHRQTLHDCSVAHVHIVDIGSIVVTDD